MLNSYDFRQPADGKSLWGMRLRWAAAGLLVTFVHGAVVWLAVSWRVNPAEAAEPAQSMVIELAALAVDPELAEVDVPPTPDMVKTEPPTVEEPAPAETAEKPTPEPEPEQAVEAPLPPTTHESDVVMETAKPKIVPKVVPKPVRETKPKEPKREVRQAKVEHHKPERAAPPRAAASRLAAQPGAAAPVAAAAPVSGASIASWRGSLIAHLNRYKRFPAGANGAGAASVAFTIDRSGRVLSSSLVRSSGDAALDGEAVAMMRRASPVPQPPENMGGRTISLAVPIRFNR